MACLSSSCSFLLDLSGRYAKTKCRVCVSEMKSDIIIQTILLHPQKISPKLI